MKDVKVYDGSGWQSLKGPPGPTAVSSDSGNGLTIGSDGLLFGREYTLDSDCCIFCKNGDDILAKYAQAKALRPNGKPISGSNRATLVVLPGIYGTGGSPFQIDASFVDVLGLGALRNPTSLVPAVRLEHGIHVSSPMVRVTGLTAFPLAFTNDGGIAQQFFDCRGADGSFNGTPAIYSWCLAGNNSFGGGAVAGGGYYDCAAGANSFGGGGGVASGTFVGCRASASSFGGDGEASGSFIDCRGDDHCFGGDGVASGSFNNCVGKSGSFGGAGGFIAPSAVLIGCRMANGRFPAPQAGAILRYCLNSDYSEADTP